MFNITSVYDDVKRFNFSNTFAEFSRVEIDVSDDKYEPAGSKTGRTLRGFSPWATKQVAKDVLEQVKGFTYQPYTANSVALDPAVELGDGVFVRDVYSGIYTMETRFGKTYVADISAPSEEEIDHEFPYEPQTERKINRRIRNAEATLKVQSDEITAKVSSVGGNDDGSFSWSLTKDAWRIKANGSTILKVSKDGFWFSGDGTFTGNIYAKNIQSGGSAGYIGTGVLSSGINTSLVRADFSHKVFNRGAMAESVWTSAIRVGQNGEMYRPGTIAFYDSMGNYREYKVLMLASE